MIQFQEIETLLAEAESLKLEDAPTNVRAELSTKLWVGHSASQTGRGSTKISPFLQDDQVSEVTQHYQLTWVQKLNLCGEPAPYKNNLSNSPVDLNQDCGTQNRLNESQRSILLSQSRP